MNKLFLKQSSATSLTEKKSIYNNFFALTLIQGTNFVLPLLVLPYLIKTIGFHNFGLVSYAQALMSYFIIFTDYGFNLNSTRDISFLRDEADKVTEIVWTTFLTKFFLCVLAFVALILVVSFSSHFKAESQLYYLAFMLVLGQVLIPTWFFQGMEKMKYLTFINLVAKIIFTILIFGFIKQPGDYKYVTVLYSLGNVISGVVAIYIMHTKFGIPFSYPRSYNLLTELRKGWYVFLSNFSINAYTNSNLFILGFFTNGTIVGYYSIAEKVIYALRQILNIFFQATYPQACKQALQGISYLRSFFKKYFPLFAAAIFAAGIVCFLLADVITQVLCGTLIREVSFLIRLTCFVPFIICLNIPAYQTLLAYSFQKSYMAILTTGSVLNIVLNAFLAKQLASTGTAIAVISTELFITAGLYLVLHLRHRSFSLL